MRCRFLVEVDVKSLEDLKKIAEGFNIPIVLKKGDEYLCFVGRMGPAPLCYRFKK